MIEGTVESLDQHGVFTGWLRDTGDPDPVMVEIRTQGSVAARAVAMSFRADLLRGLHGHGHYGFRASVQMPLPPGPAVFELFLPRHGNTMRTRLVVPVLIRQGATTVEALLRPEPAWAPADLLANIACLDLPTQRSRMGTPRFIDAAYRFALCRWPSSAETQVYAAALDEGGLAANDLLTELLLSRERKDLGGALVSPWDAGFPFPRGTDAQGMDA